MNTAALLEQAHMQVLQTVDDCPESEWDIPGVCENWSVKDTISHITAYELLLIDTLNKQMNDTPTPYLDKFVQGKEEFNKSEVAARQYHTSQQVIDEYNDAQLQSTALLALLSPDKITQAGTIPWNKERSVSDMITLISAHTSEHCAQIKAFRIREHV